MYENHPHFPLNHPLETNIWRYMDFTKFVSMLDKKALYFPRADTLGDKFEGSFTKMNVESRPDYYSELPGIEKFMSKVHKKFPKQTFISCWHMNIYESSAMWNTYIKSGEGIAIQSNIKRLIKTLTPIKDINFLISEVNYIDYNKDYIREDNFYAPFLHKRKSFEHEHELRAIFSDLDFSDTTIMGKYIPIKVEYLIETIYIAPTASNWFKDLVKSVSKKYGFNLSMKHSDLNEDPVY